MAKKDYYNILGLSEEDKKLQGKDFEKVLKQKYRKIALEKHPDRLQNASEDEKKKAEADFKEASEAYDTLLNHREEYDNPTSGFNGGADFSSMNMDDILRHFNFGFGNFGFDPFNMGGSSQRNVRAKGASMRIQIGVTLEEILNGSKRKVKYKRDVKCHHCGGSGMTSESKVRTCKTCGGSGMVFSNNGFMQTMRTCPTCGGKKTYIENPCPHCNGIGLEASTNEIEIEIPKGVMDGMTFTYQGMGSDAPHGDGDCGDLLVVFREVDHDKFVREGADLIFDLEIGVVDAMLGCDANIVTLGGKSLTAKIPQGTADGQQMRFKGYGLPTYGSNKVGNMIGIVRLRMPKALNANEKKLLEDLRKEEHFKNNS